MINLSNKLISFIVKEHTFKKDVMYKTMTHISNLIVDDSTAQSLTPTINSIMQVSLKNDEIILKLVEIIKKYGESSLNDDEELNVDEVTDELINLIEQESSEQKELTKHLDKKIKDSDTYNTDVKRTQEQIKKLEDIG